MKKFSILILVVFLASTVFGAVGSSQFQVLKFSPSVRANSMGDSLSSVVSGVDSTLKGALQTGPSLCNQVL